jgi:hypothetical protein
MSSQTDIKTRCPVCSVPFSVLSTSLCCRRHSEVETLQELGYGRTSHTAGTITTADPKLIRTDSKTMLWAPTWALYIARDAKLSTKARVTLIRHLRDFPQRQTLLLVRRTLGVNMHAWYLTFGVVTLENMFDSPKYRRQFLDELPCP